MSSLPSRCLVDTNVAKNANLATTPDPSSDVPMDCVINCIMAVTAVTQKGGLVVDDAGEIFEEYMANLSLSGQPGVGDMFLKWVHDNQWNPQMVDRVSITKLGESYREFPVHKRLAHFDKSDRKFVAVANTHPEKPPVLQASDSKWWGWKSGLQDAGINVNFLCADYIEAKYRKKMGHDRKVL